jgi:[ribosomal protein S5]-alanine N-acetyltransferase
MLLPALEHLPSIETPRLALRWLTPDDTDDLFAIFGDPDVCRYWSRPPLADRSRAEALRAEIVAYFEERSLFQWGVADRTTDRIVGTCTLASLSELHQRAEIGFALARSAWGRGFMTEAVSALLRFAFETLGLHRIEADVDPRNARSIKLLEQMGFVREGYLRERYHQNDEWQDAILYGLLHNNGSK